MSWQAATFVVLALVLLGGFLWYERERPPARVLALVAALAALAVVGRLAFAALPNVKPTTDIVLFAGYALGALPGFAVGAVTALVSNVFLSQGPWTVWQMVGWGGVGAGAALLARLARRRELGRVKLALACGVAGLAFGAWMDVYQWTLASRQDLDSYLAVAASSLPYNLAHAIGNVIFCMVIGPVFIRALRRYRRRLEVSWEPAPALAAALAVLALLAGGATAQPAEAASASSRAASYLLRSQNRDGGFGAARGQRSNQLHTGWAALGLASAGRNPRDIKRRGGRSVTRYLNRGAGSLRDVGELERTIMVLRAAGLSARRFAAHDLVAAVKGRRRGDGSIAGYVSYTAFGVMALRAAGQSDDGAQAAYLLRAQNGDGGFGVAASSSSDADMTGAALQALAAAGRASGSARSGAVGFLRAAQNGDGGFGQFRGRSSNAQSTAYAVQGLVAAHAAPGAVARALGYLKRLQRSDGSIRYSRVSAQTPVWVTAQALMALRRSPLPIARVARQARTSTAVAAAAEKAAAARPTSGRARPGGGGGAAATAPPGGPTGDAGRAGAAAAARLSGLETRRTGAAGSRRAPLVAGSGGGPTAWIVALVLVAAVAALILGRRRIARLLEARRPFLRRPVG